MPNCTADPIVFGRLGQRIDERLGLDRALVAALDNPRDWVPLDVGRCGRHADGSFALGRGPSKYCLRVERPCRLTIASRDSFFTEIDRVSFVSTYECCQRRTGLRRCARPLCLGAQRGASRAPM